MAKGKTLFLCQECGYVSPKWLGRCPECGQWNTLVEEIQKQDVRGDKENRLMSDRPQPIVDVVRNEYEKKSTGIGELDRVLGGGIVSGSLVLIGGDPGIGKSTLLLQVARLVSRHHGQVLYVSGEESPQQIKIRADRLGDMSDNMFVFSATDITQIKTFILRDQLELVVIDSIQTIFDPGLSSAPGSVGQVRECTAHLMGIAKNHNIPIFIVGHVTKEGMLAGPRVLEHMVDSVLYFEGDRHQSFRILRGVKNRFGSTNEIGIFEMHEDGLREVLNPSELFLSAHPDPVPGSAVIGGLEGTRPVLVEIQALVSQSTFPAPRRMTTGVDYNRVCLIMAVLEKKIGLRLQNQDAYVNAVGGIRMDEPAADLGIALAIASSFRNCCIPNDLMVMGEVGLTGEVRSISQVQRRIQEAEKLGFKKCVIPKGNLMHELTGKTIEIIAVGSLEEALHILT